MTVKTYFSCLPAHFLLVLFSLVFTFFTFLVILTPVTRALSAISQRPSYSANILCIFPCKCKAGLSQAENEIRINLEHEYCDTNTLIYYFSNWTEKLGLKLRQVFLWHCKSVLCEGESDQSSGKILLFLLENSNIIIRGSLGGVGGVVGGYGHYRTASREKEQIFLSWNPLLVKNKQKKVNYWSWRAELIISNYSVSISSVPSPVV